MSHAVVAVLPPAALAVVDDGTAPPRRWRTPVVYGVLVGLPLAVTVLVLRTVDGAGTVVAPAVTRLGAGTLAPAQVLPRLLLAAVVIAVAAHLGGTLLARLGQPPVIGEMAAGFLLGPSLLGTLAPGLTEALLPPGVMPYLDVLAQLGVVFFMFGVGWELPLALVRSVRSTAVVVAHASIATPLLLGVLLALALPASYRPAGVPRLHFALFVGLALSMTAFPVLARILHDRGLSGTRLGALGMAVAGIGDVTAWCGLVLVVTIARGGGSLVLLRTVLLTALFLAAMWWVVRPLLARLFASGTSDTTGSAVALLAVLLLSAATTDLIGIHAVFGAFLAGAVMPRGAPRVTGFCFRLEGLTCWLLLPLFFATVGLRTDLREVVGSTGWPVLLAVVAVAVTGKLVGASVASRAMGIDRRTALGVGVLMNCRGLTEIVVLNVGLSLGVIGRPLFTVLVAMALLTTAMTGPLLSRLRLDPGAARATPLPQELAP